MKTYPGTRVPVEPPSEIVPSRDFPPLFEAVDEIAGATFGRGDNTNAGNDRGEDDMDDEKTDPGSMPGADKMPAAGGGGDDASAKSEIAAMLGASPEQVDMMLKETGISAGELLSALKENPQAVDQLKQAIAGQGGGKSKPKPEAKLY